MRGSRLPNVYLLFVLLTALQPAVFVLGGMQFSSRAVPFMLLLLLGLGYGSRIAWWLLILLNAVPLLAVGGISFASGGHTLWGNVLLMVLTGLALEAVLLSPQMREHIGSRRRGAARSSIAFAHVRRR